MPDPKKIEPHGLWKSPITPVNISRRLRFYDVRFSGDGSAVIWLEGRSDRGVLVMRQGISGPRDLTAEESVRGGVGYGGGEFTTGGETVIFTEHGSRLFRRELGYSLPRPITPAFGSVASPALSPDGRRVAFVYSDGHEDCLAIVDSSGQDWPVKFARGADFYMQPTWSPRGDRVAWVEWNHPNMPWDGTRLMMSSIPSAPPYAPVPLQVAGDERTPAVQPQFSPDGRWLSYIEASGEWDRLVLLDLNSGQTRVLVLGDGFNLTEPIWVQGVHTYGWSHDSRIIYNRRSAHSFFSLWETEVESGASRQIDTSPYTWLGQLSVAPDRDELAFLASAPDVPDRVVRWNGSDLIVEAYSQPETVGLGYLPKAQEIHWPVPEGAEIYGLYYPPANQSYAGTGLPPAIVHVHGGPTGGTPARYDGEVAYFTSRGYGWLEVNYRGSSGYGRSYQDMLLGRWGDVDVEDTVGAARALAEQGLADGSRLAIMGGSAGGYTVLNALIRYPGLFKAGICMFGVSNLFTLAVDTHKFEERYTISLVGSLPEAAARYREWSPIFHADRIQDPVAVFQGAEDKVVVPSQSESIVAALRQRGIPNVYKLYEGEGHGFRKSETISDFLQTVEKFLLDHVLFAG